MKKVLSFIFAVCFVFLFSVCSFATTVEVYLENIGMTIGIPSSYIYATQNTDFDKLLSYGENEGLKTLKMFFESGLYELFALNINTSESIMVIVMESANEDYRSLSRSELKAAANSAKDSLESAGATVYDYGIIDSSDINFIKVESSFNGEKAPRITYNTVKDGKQISVTFNLDSEDNSEANKKEYDEIIENIRFNDGDSSATQQYTYTEQEESEETKDEIFYNDSESGVKFYLNGSWEESNDIDSDSNAKVTYTYPDFPSAIIQYIATDLLSFVEESNESFRYAMDNDYLSEEDLNEIMGKDYTVEEINGKEYYKKETIHDDTLGVKQIMLIHVEYGWIHMFSYAGMPQSDRSLDFQKMIEKTEYTAPESLRKYVMDSSNDIYADNYTEEESGSDSFLVIIGLFLIAAGVVAVIFFIRKNKNKKAPNNIYVENYAEKTSEYVPYSNEKVDTVHNLVCGKCGETVLPDSRFCQICGNEIKKEIE